MALVIFDVGGVLVQLNSRAMFEELATYSSVSAGEIAQELARSKVEHRLNLGDEAAYCNTIREILNQEVSDTEIMLARRKLLPGAIDEMIALKRQLHDAGHTIGILSTIDSATRHFLDTRWPEMLENYGGPREFSYERKLLKPDPLVYQPFVGIADHTIYIEDKVAYLKYPVENLGWIGIHLTSYQDMNEPIRKVDPAHHHADITQGEWHEAATPKEVAAILRKQGLEF